MFRNHNSAKKECLDFLKFHPQIRPGIPRSSPTVTLSLMLQFQSLFTFSYFFRPFQQACLLQEVSVNPHKPLWSEHLKQHLAARNKTRRKTKSTDPVASPLLQKLNLTKEEQDWLRRTSLAPILFPRTPKCRHLENSKAGRDTSRKFFHCLFQTE